jgi:hypothetical protein
MTEGQTGVAANFEHDVVTSKAYNNRFDNNTYKLNNNDPHYRWTNTITTAQWKAAGQDKNSIWK